MNKLEDKVSVNPSKVKTTLTSVKKTFTTVIISSCVVFGAYNHYALTSENTELRVSLAASPLKDATINNMQYDTDQLSDRLLEMANLLDTTLNSNRELESKIAELELNVKSLEEGRELLGDRVKALIKEKDYLYKELVNNQ